MKTKFSNRLRDYLSIVVGLLLAVTLGLAPAADAISAPPKPKFDHSDPQRYGREIVEYRDTIDTGWIDKILVNVMTPYDVDGNSVECHSDGLRAAQGRRQNHHSIRQPNRDQRRHLSDF
ncbi:MAG: hypothetical protein M2R45_04557 [Verrucomicrobia subdivision 3 bacterium]|nr:hypothetical protein [Limisphaerales bacterium]MCS1416804.1 hypothetical protein [Limisphaerales bacterium]